MRQLQDRITHSFVVPAMPPGLVAEFLDFRLRAAGYEGPAVFSPQAARLIARTSKGIVRRINILADKALLAAFAADARTVDVRHARAAIQESPFRAKNSFQNAIIGSRFTTALLLLIAVLLGGIGWLLRAKALASDALRPW
jgi:hypothetical protein